MTDDLPIQQGSQAPAHQSLDATHVFVRDERRIRGPFVVGAVQAMQQRGEVRRETLISPDRVRWVAAGDLPDIFPEQFFDRQVPSTANEMQWHYVSKGRRQGPVSWDVIQTMAADGSLQPLDSILPERSETRVPARSIDGLQFQRDDDLLGLKRHRKIWLFGASTFVLLMMVIPTIFVLSWDEGRIRDKRAERLTDEERAYDTEIVRLTQEHETRIAKLTQEYEDRIAALDRDTSIRVAELGAMAVGAKVEAEKRMHQERVESEERMHLAEVEAENRRHREDMAESDRRHQQSLDQSRRQHEQNRRDRGDSWW